MWTAIACVLSYTEVTFKSLVQLCYTKDRYTYQEDVVLEALDVEPESLDELDDALEDELDDELADELDDELDLLSVL